MSTPADAQFEKRVVNRTRTLVDYIVLSLLNEYHAVSRPATELEVLKRLQVEVEMKIAKLGG